MCFEELKIRLDSRLKAIAYRLGNRAAFLNADDLYQEELIHLWNCFQQGTLSDKTESYILQGCYFYLQNYLRTTMDKRSLVSFDALNTSAGEGVEMTEFFLTTSVADEAFALESRLIADKLMNNGLTKREKEVCALFLEGLTVREVGQRLGISHVRVIKIKNNIKQKYSYLFEELSSRCMQ